MTAKLFDGSYRHTQNGKFIILPVLAMAVALTISAIFEIRQLLIPVPILLAVAWLFHSLTVEITDRALCWRFGPGLIRKSVPLAEIVSAAPVKTSFLEGWGIHLSRYGWLYNVSGFDAVAITLRNGKRFALGTDEPQALAGRLAEVIRG